MSGRNKKLIPVSGAPFICMLLCALFASCASGSSDNPADGDSLADSPGAGSISDTIIDHSNYDPAGLSDVQISAAADLDSYFQHASVGGNVVEGLTALAVETGSRYVMDMTSVTGGSSTDPLSAFGADGLAWFDSNNGLADHNRGNPGAAQKLVYFSNAFADSSLASKIDAASFKFCWIDDPSPDNAYYGTPDFTTGQSLFDDTQAVMDSVSENYPGVAFIWWTMPIHAAEASAERQAFNDLVRQYCAENDLWLLDIAALESHDDNGSANVNGDGIEMLCAEYTYRDENDGGHLNDAGERKLALAWWRLMAGIAAAQ